MFMTCSTVSTRTLQKPWYKSFTGTMAHVEPQKYMVYGNIARLSPTSLEITELPIRSWTQAYKENVLEPMLHGTEKAPPFITYVQTELWGGGGVIIQGLSLWSCLYSDYKEYHTDTTVKFVVTVTGEKMQEAETVGFHKKFKLESSINTSNLVSGAI